MLPFGRRLLQQLRLIITHALCHNASMTMVGARNMLYYFSLGIIS